MSCCASFAGSRRPVRMNGERYGAPTAVTACAGRSSRRHAPRHHDGIDEMGPVTTRLPQSEEKRSIRTDRRQSQARLRRRVRRQTGDCRAVVFRSAARARNQPLTSGPVELLFTRMIEEDGADCRCPHMRKGATRQKAASDPSRPFVGPHSFARRPSSF